MALSTKERDALPDSDFAVPGKRKLPIHDEEHTRLAWDMVDRTEGLTEEEKAEARRRILDRAKTLGIDTGDWEKSLTHAAVIVLDAMALQLPEIEDHPNRMPFRGIFTYVDRASDFAVGGAGGNRTFLPRAAAEQALPSLLGMPIDFSPAFDHHDVRRKIGTISAATIGPAPDGTAIFVEGFFFKADFPDECARIKAQQHLFGFSSELHAVTRPMEDGVIEIVSGKFTGGAVLYKAKAAYQSTSLAAQRAETEVSMTKEELQALLSEAVGPVKTALDTLTADVAALKAKGAQSVQANAQMVATVKPHADRLRECAASMEAAGIGLHSESGHVRMLRHMAGQMESDAAEGKLPHIYRDHDWMFHGRDPQRQSPEDPALKAVETKLAAAVEGLASLTTLVTDLKASAFGNSPPPARQTIPPEITTLISKGAITEEKVKGGLTEGELSQMLDKGGVTNRQDRIAVKLAAGQAGLLKAA